MMKKFDENKFLSDCFNSDWSNVMSCQTDVNVMYNSFSTTFLRLCDKHAPFKHHTTKVKNSNYKKPWITADLRKKICKKDYAYRQSVNSPLNSKLKTKFKSIRNAVTKELRNAKANYFKNLLETTSDPKKYWRVLNQQCWVKIIVGLHLRRLWSLVVWRFQTIRKWLWF